MRIILNNFAQRTPQGSSVNISRAMSDPVPTCSVTLVDNASTIQIPALAEMLVLDDQAIPNPTINCLPNPALNPYTAFWAIVASYSGVTVAQNGGGGISVTVNNAAAGTDPILRQDLFASTAVTPGQTYVLSAYVQGSGSPTNVGAYLEVDWFDGAGTFISSTPSFGPTPVSTSLNRYSFTVTAPANAVFNRIILGIKTTSGTNSGTVTFTQVQFEPQWFADIAYPTPFCGPGQTNCTQIIATATFIRQYRKFAGFVLHSTYGNYRGNVRDITLDAVGYAWIYGTILTNKSYTNQFDSAILADLNSTLLNGLFTTTNVVQGIQLSSLQSTWDDLRTIHDNLASQSGYYWTADYYWNLIYAPPGYITMPISLICDNSSTPDMVTTFPAYNFSWENDFTQPGNNVLVIGSGTNVAQVIDPQTMYTNMLQFSGGFQYFGASYFMRKVNESSLQSITDCVNRGIAEILQYDYARNLYHLSTNVELIPGQAIRVTSGTDGLNNTTLLIQSVSASWLGKDETLDDVWEYQADLGAVNRASTNIISRLARLSNENTSAPAITQTSLVVVERLGIQESTTTGSATTGYVQTIQGDGPVGYYRLNEKTGTVADDMSGRTNQGTLAGGITLGVTGLLTSGGDTAMTFNGTSGIITLPTSMVPTGAAPWSLECWFKFASIPASGFPTLMGWGNNTGNQRFGVLNLKTNGGASTQLVLSTNNGDIQSGNLSINTVYHAVGTYDGTATRLYLNGSLVAGPTNFTLNLAQSLCSIGAFTAYGSSFFPATIDEVAFYTYALNSTQVANHYTVGTT